MESEILPVRIKGIKGGIYANFRRRLVAAILDLIIWLPIFVFIEYLNELNRFVYFFTIIPYLFLLFLFQIYLVKRYGGTPGKLIVRIKIIKKDGEDVDWNAAIMRYIISFVIAILSVFWMANSLLKTSDDVFMNLDYWERFMYLMHISPVFFKAEFLISNIWLYSELIFLFTNQRKRSIQDYMAGTVVIKKKYLNQIKEIQKNTVQ